MNEENHFVSSLLNVAKELKKAEYVRKFKEEFDKEMSGEIKANSISDRGDKQADDVTMEKPNANMCLNMEVFEDKDYDIEEVKFWNFISKNKGMKPSIIRTVVYKYPESSYIVKKTPVYLPKPEKVLKVDSTISETESAQPTKTPTIESQEPKKAKYQEASVASSTPVQPETQTRKVGRPKGSTNNSHTNTAKANNKIKPEPAILNEKAPEKVTPSVNKQATTQPLKSSEKLNELLKSSKASTINDSTKQKLAAQSTAHFVSKNYKMEDLIMIDEDDDIIGYNESDEEENYLAEAQMNEQNNIVESNINDNCDGEFKGAGGNNNKNNEKQDSDKEATNIKEEIAKDTMDAKVDENKTNEAAVEIDSTKVQSLRTTRTGLIQKEVTRSLSPSSRERKPRAGSDTQDSNTGNKRKLSQTDQVNSLKNAKPEKSQATDNSLNENQETAATTSSDDVVNTGRVARVTRSKSKLTSNHCNTGVHSPASSTSSNK